MHTQHEPASPWTAPRLVALGTAGGSQAAVTSAVAEYSFAGNNYGGTQTSPT